jgi:hypothetical protein
MKTGKNPHSSVPFGLVEFLVAYLGGGAATNCSTPANGTLTDDAAGLFPTKCNKGLLATYVSTGLYTCTFLENMQVKHLLHADPIVVSDGASPTAALKAVVTKLTPSTRTITVKVYTPAGVLTDLGTSDLLVMRVLGRDSSE